VAPVARSELLGQKLGRSDSQIHDTLSTRFVLVIVRRHELIPQPVTATVYVIKSGTLALVS
jgi:hypothetical protein